MMIISMPTIVITNAVVTIHIITMISIMASTSAVI